MKTRQKQAILHVIPTESIPLFCMPKKFRSRLNRVVVHPYQTYVSSVCCNCYYVGIDWRTTSPGYFTSMGHLLHHCYFVPFSLEIFLSFGLVWIVNFDLQQLALGMLCMAGANDSE